MADLINTIMEARNGALAVKLSRDFTKLVEGVVTTNQRGKMTISLDLRPSRADDGAIQVSISSDTKLKIPEFGVGSAIFFVNENLELTRTDPRQAEMFGEAQPPQLEKKANA